MTQKVLDKKVAGDFGISQNWQQQVKEWCKISEKDDRTVIFYPSTSAIDPQLSLRSAFNR